MSLSLSVQPDVRIAPTESLPFPGNCLNGFLPDRIPSFSDRTLGNMDDDGKGGDDGAPGGLLLTGSPAVRLWEPVGTAMTPTTI